MSDVKRLPNQSAGQKPGQKRKEQAAATRRRIVDAAYRLFCEQGYALTTMESIGREARVAVQTVYYVFRTKAHLLREVIEVTAAGLPEPAPVMQRGWMQEALSALDGHRALALVIEHGVDIYARMAPLSQAVHTAAASDPDIDAHWQNIAAARRTGMGQLITTIAAHGHLRHGLTPERAADIMFVINSHETFLGLTRDAGWTVPEFKAWLYETLSSQLFPPHGKVPPNATKDLSFHDLVQHR
ncbi:TetR/AcrR family transcriptional regulator [Catelliglobosispora koreensis]|uniref:TetR/AcrR family transcriptional regulator n=1 Tax=Catelliglobosispora koreensis TaxID=129052 RepID=UPI000362C418|nr:TetR/AcrR family transcriptional regulator [Catelliglobosispora koreensis]